MDGIQTELEEVITFEPRVFGDNRGWFMESWSKREVEQLGVSYEFVQDNHSFSAQKGTLRGLHFQMNPFSQAKLVRCARGAILDVAVDIRKGSKNYGKWVAVELSAENKKQLLIPHGFAHGFLTLTDNVEILYKADQYYTPQADRSIAWNDPFINVQWGITDPILSRKDQEAPLLANSDANFVLGEKR